MKRVVCIVLVAVAVSIGTWSLGWWAVPVIALGAGWLRCPGGLVSVGAGAAWLLLLAADMASGNVSRVADVLAGIMGMPSIALVAATLALPALLGWSAAVIGTAARSMVATSRLPS